MAYKAIHETFWTDPKELKKLRKKWVEQQTQISTLIFKRDNYICQKCGYSKGGNLEAHHIQSFALFPSLRFDITNGITLCKKCHKETENYGYKKRN